MNNPYSYQKAIRVIQTNSLNASIIFTNAIRQHLPLLYLQKQ